MKKLSWLFRIAAAVILFQTLYFKFSGHPESVELFTKLGVEPWGRYATGVMELITGILLLIPFTAWLGALLGIGLMGGAILSHLTVLGIQSQGDGGTLFILALVTLFCCGFTLFIFRNDALQLIRK